MIRPIHFRGFPATDATAKSAASTATTASLAASVLAALLRTARAAGAFVCGKVRAAIAHLTALFRATDPAIPTPPTAAATSHTATAATIERSTPTNDASLATRVHTATVNAADERPITSRHATHNVLARRAAIDPNLPDIEVPAFLPAFDELLLPPPLARPLDDAARARRLDFYAQSYFLQSHLARDRIREAYREEQRQAAAAAAAASSTVEEPLQDPAPYTSFACGCGWCPNGTAAYPLCAAVTIRRRMRRDSGDRYKSVARDLSRRQSLYGHHVDAAAIFAGRTRG